MSIIRVSAAQFSTGCDVDENLATTLRMIDTAADQQPLVIVLPEFCNHLSVYDDGDHAWSVAIDIDGPWIQSVGERARRHTCWIQLNCTVRRAGESTAREPTPGRITNTNFVFSPDGVLMTDNDKTVLMGAEGEYLSAADEPADLIDAGFATIGSYACMDGVIAEVPRGLVLRGATLLLNSLNSFALDEASLHVPVRAAENKTWLVACCKVGPLLPADKVAMFSAAMNVPDDALCGAGESQIVAPDGTVVAMGPRTGEAVVIADIDLSAALDKRRPDGTDVLAARRPGVYSALADPTPQLDDHHRGAEIMVAVCAIAPAVDPIPLVRDAVASGAQLVVLPEFAADGRVHDLRAVAGDAVIVSTIREGDEHVGIALTAAGIIGRQVQIHEIEANSPWQSSLGSELTPVDLPWGRLAIIVGDDSIFPEVSRMAALASCDVVAVPFTQREAWETHTGLIERAAENRMCLVAANAAGHGAIIDLPPDFTLWAPSRTRVFDGTINQPDVVECAPGGTTMSTIHPERAVNRQISKGTNLVDGRPWKLATALVSPWPASII